MANLYKNNLNQTTGALRLLPSPSDEIFTNNLHFLATEDQNPSQATITANQTAMPGYAERRNYVQVYGKVIYERIMSYTPKQKPDIRYEGGQAKYSEIVFNWNIESQIPPSTVLYANEEPVPGSYPQTGYNTSYQSLDTGWIGYYNAPITKVVVRLRKINNTYRTNDGGMKLVQQLNYYDPFDAQYYEEVAKVTIPVTDLPIPPESTVNDTNRGYNATQRPFVRNKTKIQELRGYSDFSITMSTLGAGSVTYTAADGQTKTVQIGWISPNYKFEHDRYYYMTLEPEIHPSTGRTDTDGWYGIEKMWPLHYRGDVYFLDYYKIDDLVDGQRVGLRRRFSLGTPETGGWTRGEHTVRPETILGKMETPSLFWSDNDSLIDSTEFYMYGLNIRARGEVLQGGQFFTNTSNYTKRDQVDAKAEYFAWFKTPFNQVSGKITFDITTASVGVSRNPIVTKSINNTFESIPGTNNKKATIYGFFYYDTLDFYLEYEFDGQEKGARDEGQNSAADEIKAQIESIRNTLKVPGDRPKACGFRVKNNNAQTPVWKNYIIRQDLDEFKFKSYIKSIPQSLLNFENDDIDGNNLQTSKIVVTQLDEDYGINFMLKIPDEISAQDDFVYQVWIQKSNGQKFYATPNKVEASADEYPVNIGPPTLSSFVNPPSKDKGFWYQVYNTWEQVTSDPGRKQLPYLRRLNNLDDAKVMSKNFPVHYYMDYEFRIGRTYQFRTTAETYLRGKGATNLPEDNSSNAANLHVVLPWTENVKINPAYVNKNISDLSNTDKLAIANVNYYVYSNINSYSIDNVKGLDKYFEFEDMAAKPRNLIMSRHNPQNPITYSANSNFTQGIAYVGISECEWMMQGYAAFNFMLQTTTGAPTTGPGSQVVPLFVEGEPMAGKGWHWLEHDKTLVWFDKIPPLNNTSEHDMNLNLPVGGNALDYLSNKAPHVKFLLNNFVARYIKQQSFNLSFDYENITDLGLNIYLGTKLPYQKSQSEWFLSNIEELIANGELTFVGRLAKTTGVKKCNFYGLVGNRYLIFVAEPIARFSFRVGIDGAEQIDDSNLDLVTQRFTNGLGGYRRNGTGDLIGDVYSIIRLSNFSFSMGYHQSNNQVVEFDSTLEQLTPSGNPSYSVAIGTGNDVFANQPINISHYTTKVGNGNFLKGLWENGVWNNGRRQDTTRYEFYDVSEYYSYNRGRIWRIKVKGREDSARMFDVGDRVSVGNLTAIDINSERKLLKRHYFVVAKGTDYIEIEYNSDFPIMRIEKDSEMHRIWVSKNIWLNGVFFNGYFDGIWNDGIWAGYPMLTRMEKSNWIDGTFYGGHFTADKYKLEFESVSLKELNNVARLGISFSTPHRLTKNDLISLTYSISDIVYSVGTTTVAEVTNDNEIITGLVWKPIFSDIKKGNLLTTISSGLIQNFKFYSRNVSTVTSLESMNTQNVFSYDSWIDVNYSDQTAVNIGRSQYSSTPTTKRTFSENNLYGYPTTDVLSSTSVFRDSYSTAQRSYRLGSKYRLTGDYVGDVSAFEDFFDSTDTAKGKAQFESKGWDFDVPGTAISIYAASQSVQNGLLQLYFTDELAGIAPVNTDIRILGTGTNSTDDYLTFDDVSKITLKTNLLPGWKIETDNSREGWTTAGIFTLVFTASNSMTFSRTAEPVTDDTPLQGKELKISVFGDGGTLDLMPQYEVGGRINGTEQSTVGAGKYTMVEFDLVDYKLPDGNQELSRINGMRQPPIHFNNINKVKREYGDSFGVVGERIVEASYLPLVNNVNHLNTFGQKKQEYFFNKRNLQMSFSGVGAYGNGAAEFYIDNLKLYEVDMIPFFQYFIDEEGGVSNINSTIQIPRQATSPEISFINDEVTENFTDNYSDNEISSYFSERIIGESIKIPTDINWEQDYSIYRTQIIDLDDPNELYNASS